MVSSGELSRDDIIWHEGLTEWQPIHSVVSLPAPTAPQPAPVQQGQPASPQSAQVETNVRQGAIIGGWVCFGLGLISMFISLFMFLFYGTFFLVAFILSIVAMAQRRVLGGVVLLVATLVVPSILALVLFATRASEFAEDIAESIEETSVSDPYSESGSEPESFADAMKRGFEEAERDSDLKTLEELRNRKVEFDKKLAALKSFRVLSANFTKEDNSIGMTEPLIELTVQNDTDHSVKRAYFRGVLASPGRAIPWIDDTFNYEIAGGVEPGEKTTWRLTPNMFGDWGKVEIRPDSMFNVTVIRLDGPDSEELFGDARFGEHDEKRLAELERKYKSEQEPESPLSVAAQEKKFPLPLIEERTWTQASDEKTISARVLHIRDDVVVMENEIAISAFEIEILKREDRIRIRAAEESAPAFCVGLLFRADRQRVNTLLGEPSFVSDNGKYWDFENQGARISVRFENDIAAHVLMDTGYDGDVKEIRKLLGLEYLSLGSMTRKGITHEYYMVSTEQGVWKFRGTPNSSGGFSVVNIDFP